MFMLFCNHLEEEEKTSCLAIIVLHMHCYNKYFLWLFLVVPWVGLQCAIVVFLDHTHLLFDIFCNTALPFCHINRGSYMSAYVLLNLLNELSKRDQKRCLPSILSIFRKSLMNSIIHEHEC